MNINIVAHRPIGVIWQFAYHNNDAYPYNAYAHRLRFRLLLRNNLNLRLLLRHHLNLRLLLRHHLILLPKSLSSMLPLLLYLLSHDIPNMLPSIHLVLLHLLSHHMPSMHHHLHHKHLLPLILRLKTLKGLHLCAMVCGFCVELRRLQRISTRLRLMPIQLKTSWIFKLL